MAEKTKKVVAPKFVTVEQFAKLENSVGTLVELMTKQMEEKQVAEVKTKVQDADPLPSPSLQTPEEKAIKRAGPNHSVPVNPEWEQVARDIIGEAVDHCEMQHLRSGGVIFHVIIKKDFSNAPDEYINRMKEDRRSREIGAEGIGGVEAWCKLIKSNLSRGKAYVSNE